LGRAAPPRVLRNLCHQIVSGVEGGQRWGNVSASRTFSGILEEPTYVAERGEIVMAYRSASGVRLDLSSSGRGLQQTLSLLAHLTVNPESLLLLDEPDAHLEILRQRQIYQLLTETAREYGSQIVAASHSEVVLNEAASRDVVVAFVGKPHRIDDRGAQVLKSLKEIGFEDYYQAEETGWILYLEGSTDLAILQTFADTLAHPAAEALERPFVRYVENKPQRARPLLWAAGGKADLHGLALFDRLDLSLQDRPELRERMWKGVRSKTTFARERFSSPGLEM
jgi:hypothetical protein